LIRNIVGQEESTIDMRDIMDSGKIFIVNLSKGRIGEDNSRLLGAMTITKLFLAAMSRIDIPEAERRDFFLLVDEFQNFASEAFEGILSEARKYRLSLTLAHQYIAQMDEEVRDAVFGNVGTMVTFRIGAEDAEAVEKEFAPQFMVEDFVNQPKYHIMLKLMIDGVTSPAFSARTLTPFEPEEESNREAIIEASRKKYGTPREKMEKIIAEWDIASRAKKVKKPVKKQEKPKAISLKEAAEKYPAPAGSKKKSSGSSKKKSSGSKNKKSSGAKKSSKSSKAPEKQRERIKPPKLPHEKDSKKSKKSKSKNKKSKKGPDKEGLRDLLKDIGAIEE
ncbi:MAG: type IV secretory system conjugative DNA transfer family protein, partial [Candidatus Spechtbacterales bacterium]|nr:type IV secretory system conjugative DNA transfer family protein [Candidatus Spechtbacterales bacterium]